MALNYQKFCGNILERKKYNLIKIQIWFICRFTILIVKTRIEEITIHIKLSILHLVYHFFG